MRRFERQSQKALQRGFGRGIWTVFAVLLLAGTGVTWVAMGMTAQQQWPIRWLQVDGVFERVSAEQMRASMAPAVRGSFFTVDLEAIRQAAYRQAWVADVAILKTWPDTISIRIREHTPVAHWTEGRLISTTGKLFEAPGAESIQGLPWLDGPDSQLDVVIEAWSQLGNALMPTGMDIERISLDARGSWSLELDNGTAVQIGREHADTRISRLVRSWAPLMSGREIPPVSVDLRYTNGIAVRWPKPPASLAGNYGQKN